MRHLMPPEAQRFEVEWNRLMVRAQERYMRETLQRAIEDAREDMLSRVRVAYNPDADRFETFLDEPLP